MPRGWLAPGQLPPIIGFRFFGMWQEVTGQKGAPLVIKQVNGHICYDLVGETDESFGHRVLAWKPDATAPQPEVTGWEAWELARACAGEAEDCVPRAFAAATGMPYAESIALHHKWGRKPRKGMQRIRYEKCWHAQGWQMGADIGFKGKTVRTLLRDVPQLRTGIWMVHVRAHVLCIRDGVIHDWARNRLVRVQSIRPFETVTPVT